jgi:hypothetical protein
MKRTQYLSANLAAGMLVFLLWQAQVKGETKGEARENSEVKPGAESGDEHLHRVLKSQQRKVRSAMRQRALLYEPAFAAAAARYKVDPRALWTIAYLETRFRANLTSPRHAKGLMQFVPGTGARFNLRNPYDANQSIDAAAQYLALLTKQFNGRLDLVLAAYNSGEGAVDCYLNGKTIRTSTGKLINPRGIKTTGVPPYKETQAYVRRGMLVYTRVASAGVFPSALMGTVQVLQTPNLFATAGEVAAVNFDLAEVGGTPAVLNSQKLNVPASLTTAASRQVEQGFDTVFFDVHSGTRYLVRSGEIVKPLDAVVDDAKRSEDHRDVTKSVYLGARDDWR